MNDNPATIAIPTHSNQDTNILVGIPCFGGNVNHKCCKALIRIAKLLTELNIYHHIEFLPGCSLIPQARNLIANSALFDKNPANQKTFSHLLMIDADGSFEASAVVEMLKASKPIVVLPFSRKEMFWPNIIRAVKAGIPEDRLADYNGVAMIVPVDQRIKPNEPSPVTKGGTGCILIQRAVLVGLMERHPDWIYKPTQAEQQLRGFSPSRVAVDFFHIGIREGEYHGEDYWFVCEAREAGFETFILPWITTTHTGNYDFHCNVPAFLKLKEVA